MPDGDVPPPPDESRQESLKACSNKWSPEHFPASEVEGPVILLSPRDHHFPTKMVSPSVCRSRTRFPWSVDPSELLLCSLGLLLLFAPPSASSQQHQQPSSEGFFLNGSSYAVIADSLRLSSARSIGFSFRTCTPGELLKQTGDSLDQFRLQVDPSGRLALSLTAGEHRVDLSTGSDLLDGRWHTVELRATPALDALALSVTLHGSGETVSDSKSAADLGGVLRAMNLSAQSPQLRVGAGMVACIREGPGVRFTKQGVAVISGAVKWDRCLLPYSCAGYNWPLIRDLDVTCPASYCSHGGVCVPSPPQASAPPPACLCPPGRSGRTCEGIAASCADTPCLHGATCNATGNGYTCLCDGTGFSGRHCETEDASACSRAQPLCQNGGTCLPQPPVSALAGSSGSQGRFLCDCPNGFEGRNCELQLARTANLQSGNPCTATEPHCHNGGTCMFSSSTNSANCLCQNGFEGNRCEVSTCGGVRCHENSTCVSGQCQCLPGFSGPHCTASSSTSQQPLCGQAPCQNGGSCATDGVGVAPHCVCLPGFSGANCQSALDACASAPCQNGASCRASSLNNAVECICAQGFSGAFCHIDVDECLQTPCLHGTCQNYAGGYRCACEAGWTGKNCETNTDECASSPCRNEGTCHDVLDGFRCQCPPGFTGASCETNVDDCAVSPCRNGGSCTDGVHNFTCQCTHRFMGPTCELPYNACAENACQNGGQCVRTKDERDPAGNDFYCECRNGFEGLRCEHNIDECLGVSCPVPKVCVDLEASHECRCPAGFSGVNCTDEVDDCHSSPCQNNGTCHDQPNGFRCSCGLGWKGASCEEDVDECVADERLCNNGICRNLAGSYQCYCRPGFSGNHCNHDFDECLSRPCLNDGNCTNLVNSYECVCPPGFRGINCEINIDECEAHPCMNGATCHDGINNYTCNCILGFTGHNCEININECESGPCQNGGRCDDGINSYKCDCNNTGFEGLHCETNIDECLPRPCTNNATCDDLINDYACNCFAGYAGKNCDVDINECLERPCQNDGLCFERSNQTLYGQDELAELPIDVRGVFGGRFSFHEAQGYVCSCMPGYEGLNCEVDIDECAIDPCLHGDCHDGVAQYTCVCNPGFEGTNCEVEIDECDRYQPCQHGACMDRVATYMCTCEPGWGGKNCSVALTGCQDVVCLNRGVCTPWLIGEGDHRANCSCMDGFDGLRCQSRTTFSLNGKSYIKVPSHREEGYELHMKFRTTLGNGLVAIGQGNTHFSLQLRNGRLNLHSNLISKFEGILIGENLNNTEWHKVYVAVNTSHLTLGVNDRLQATQPINPTGENDTVFFNTFLGGIVRDQQILANNVPSFTGCIQDITVNDMKITEEDFKEGVGRVVEQVQTVPGCIREEQCEPNPCQNQGSCTDLWSEYRCSCHRPFLGASCQFNYTGATFGHENTTTSLAVVNIDNPRPYNSGIDISMFIRTREQEGFIFYIGTDIEAQERQSYITGQLLQGDLVVTVFVDGKREKFQVYTVDVSDGHLHFLRVVRVNNSMLVKINETVSINHEIPSPTGFHVQKLYLGNMPLPGEIPTLATTETATMAEETFVDNQSPLDTSLSSVIEEETTTLPAHHHPITSTRTVVASAEPHTSHAVHTERPAETTLQDNFTHDLSSHEPRVLNRIKRQLNVTATIPTITTTTVTTTASTATTTTAATATTSATPFIRPKPFKGIIQDVQISNGGNYTGIVELFKFDFGERVEKPVSIGQVFLFDVKKGVVSDNTCAVNPCHNQGTCHITWNDYRCECPSGFKGRNCDEKEYCYWFACPAHSECVSLIDGHECISNATFNGFNSTVVYNPTFHPTEAAASVLANRDSIVATFRTKTNGTVLHVVNDERRKHIRVSVVEGELEIEVPEGEVMRAYLFGSSVNDGNWHKINLSFAEGIVSASMDESLPAQLSLDANLNLSEFVRQSSIVVGSALSLLPSSVTDRSRELYSTDSHARLPEDVEIHPESHTVGTHGSTSSNGLYSLVDFYRGCLGEIRIGGVLLPFFTEEQLVNSTASKKFVIRNIMDVAPKCTVCFEHQCRNGGSCASPEAVFECACPKGFEDAVCGTNIDECANHTCINGVCVDGIANYTCNCLPGWIGWTCDEDLDECLSHPCQHGGTCQQTVQPGNYTCSCPSDYVGHTCEEIRIKTCEHRPCQNGGTCRPGRSRLSVDDLYSCDCTTGFKGVDCEIKKDFCVENQQPCRNGATCISDDTTFHYRCVCPPGFTGENCEQDIDECAGQPCLNSGKCRNLIDAFECDCNGTGFEGNNCQTNINECQTDPCLFGTCSDTPGSYNCSCEPEYCGKNCQRKDPCLLTAGLCLNDGVCRPSCDTEPFYMCACAQEWTGQNCSTKAAPRTGDIALIVGPVVGGMLFIAIVGLLVFLVMARRKRRSEGKYKPATQELTSPRLQLDNMIKPPPEERLI